MHTEDDGVFGGISPDIPIRGENCNPYCDLGPVVIRRTEGTGVGSTSVAMLGLPSDLTDAGVNVGYTLLGLAGALAGPVKGPPLGSSSAPFAGFPGEPLSGPDCVPGS